MSEKNDSPPSARLVVGIVLFTLGGVLLATNLGARLPWHLWEYFPLLLIALGVWGLVRPSRSFDRSGGLWMLAAGVYALISVFNVYGLSWTTAWPIFVIAAGISVIFDLDRRCAGRHPGHCGRRSSNHEGSA
ncbi:MAG: DUF5668 domain-containing protein [Gammaproteobacteria bacterium]|nr:hypothetical protein [Gammaproteobacteria bacterium]